MGAPSVMHRDPERVALVIPVGIMGMVGGLELLRGRRRKGVEKSRRHAAEAMCFLRIGCPDEAPVTLPLPPFGGVSLLLRPPALPADTGVSKITRSLRPVPLGY